MIMRTFVLLATLLVVAPFAFGQTASVSVDHIDGLWTDTYGDIGPTETSYLDPGAATYYLRFANNTGAYVAGLTNGFVVYGPASFYPASGEEVQLPGGGYISDYFDLVYEIRTISSDGTGNDQVGFSHIWTIEDESVGSEPTARLVQGLPDGFDEVVIAIHTGCDTEGETLCLDSAYYPPSGLWLWAPGGAPDWDGPHCYEIKTCCTKRGDIDFDGTPTTIADVVYMVQYMFQFGPPPPCMGNVDWDGSGGDPDISDLIGLVAYMFQGGTPAVPCSR